MRAALERRLLTLRRLREVWAVDLAVCALGSLFGPDLATTRIASMPALDAGVQEAATAPDAGASTLDPEYGAEQVVEEHMDSDDASDAYSSGEDEDDPLAEMLDELEGAAVDLDPEEGETGEDETVAAVTASEPLAIARKKVGTGVGCEIAD